jgi:hypothetical protein
VYCHGKGSMPAWHEGRRRHADTDRQIDP